MKRNYIYLACMTVCMFALFAISSCSNEMDMPSSKIEHLQKMKQLCAQYGWTQIEGVSQEEVEERIKNYDNDYKLLQEIKESKSFQKITNSKKVKEFYNKLLGVNNNG